MPHAPWVLILYVLAGVLFGMAAFVWPPAFESYRIRFVAAGLMVVMLAKIITMSQ